MDIGDGQFQIDGYEEEEQAPPLPQDNTQDRLQAEEDQQERMQRNIDQQIQALQKDNLNELEQQLDLIDDTKDLSRATPAPPKYNYELGDEPRLKQDIDLNSSILENDYLNEKYPDNS